MHSFHGAPTALGHAAHEFIAAAGWGDASWSFLAGDASARQYFRLRRGEESVVLMDAWRNLESIGPFLRIAEHLRRLGFSTPAVLVENHERGFLLLEDFGDATFSRLLEDQYDTHKLYVLATDVLIALHRHPEAIPPALRRYDAEKMLEDVKLYLEWRAPGISDQGREAFVAAWREVLPAAHRVPSSLLLRDYHAANLMLLSRREGVRQAGLLDFQDAYQGPVTYDLMSLLEDARRDVPEGLRQVMVARYRAGVPGLDDDAFDASMAILAALRHTRVLAIFARLSRRDDQPEYEAQHSPRVEALLQRALRHPMLESVHAWFEHYGRKD